MEKKVMRLGVESICQLYALTCKEYLQGMGPTGIEFDEDIEGDRLLHFLTIMNVEFVKYRANKNLTGHRFSNIIESLIKKVCNQQRSQIESMTKPTRRKSVLKIKVFLINNVLNKKPKIGDSERQDGINAIVEFYKAFNKQFLG